MKRLCKRPGLVAIVCLVGSAWAFGQTLQGEFRLEHSEYLAGEPVWVDFQLKNLGTEPVLISVGNPYGCSDFRFEGSWPAASRFDCGIPPRGGPRGLLLLAAGKAYSERMVLNYWLELPRPGDYEITGHERVEYFRKNSLPPTGPPLATTFSGHLKLRLAYPTSADQLANTFQPYLDKLESKDEETRNEGARAITETAPPFLEPTILRMAKDPQFRFFAATGLRRLNTPKAREVLARWSWTESISLREQAVRYLGEMGDRKYLGLLRALAEQARPAEGQQAILMAYGELGREQALPFIASLLKSPNEFARGNAIWAIAKTESRDAVPILIPLLQDERLGVAAERALEALTHRTAAGRQPAFVIWEKWWEENQNRAPIFGPHECLELHPIP